MRTKVVSVLIVVLLIANITAAQASPPEVVEDAKNAAKDFDVAKLMGGELSKLKNVERILQKAEQRHAKLEERVATLERKGVDVTELKELLKEHKEKIDLARAKILEAKRKFKSGEIEAGLELIKEAKDLMDDGYELATEITALCAKTAERHREEHRGEMQEREVIKEGEHRFGNKTEHEEEKVRGHERFGKPEEVGAGMGVPGMKMSKEPLKKIRGKEIHKIYEKEFMKAKERFEKAREEFKRAKKVGIKDEHGLRMAKGYMVAGFDLAERWLERLRVHVINMAEKEQITEETKLRLLAKIDEKLAEIEELKSQINETSSPEELREVVKEIRKEWREIRKEMDGLAGFVAVAKVENLVERSKQVGLKLGAKIEELEAAGVDTTELEVTLEDFSAKIDKAEELVGKAEDMFEEGKVAEGHKTLREAIMTLKDAFKNVKEIVAELKEQHRHRIQEGKIFSGNETGEAWVTGNGTAEFTGTGVVVVRGNGTLEVSPEDAIVTLVGFGVKSVEGNVSAISGEGKAVIRGENITVRVEGEDIKLIVKGYGTLKLEGEGKYRVKKNPQEAMSEEIEYEGEVTIEFGGR
ncbi:hypothetical protein Asulf_01098 [Archaeoglobus sulfaticallidus PM70-1]|uniref:DUF5667 domain-containing protein n=1 Tax=Archaeoglobus sulfaticallidus PM70-1 TaxID=387631 RepID=N0BDM2_9EURY|nr:hypothetical protein [Archaeoglobus sulfaticallidus]AGK61098.1 hypothetical protein Asulf_01098 [Archaeoglobus sulfaticallidus PM70-1]